MTRPAFEPEALAEIAARALMLYERRDDSRVSFRETSAAVLDRRLRAWCESAAQGDDRELARRLACEGLDLEQARGLLREPCLTTTELPPWTRRLDEAVAHALAHPPSEELAAQLLPGTPDRFPFWALLLPFVDHAGHELRSRLAGRTALPADAVLAPARATLLQLLTQTCALALELELTLFKATRESSLSRLIRQAREGASASLYQEFTASFFAGRFVSFFQEYAVLARQVATAIDHWVDATAELFEHLETDRPALAEAFHGGRPLGAVVRLACALSDRHNGGRSSAFVTFESGLRVVYKPKTLDTDVAMAGLLDWINGTGELLSLRSARVLPRTGYGWQEFVAHEPCADAAAVRRFYTRSGALLGLIYALEGYDCHHENLIAGGEHPYLIDTETIFNPYKELDAISSAEANALVLAGKEIFYSVLRTGMLPTWSVPTRGRKKDISGFGGGAVEGNDTVRQIRWVDGSSDAVRREQIEEKVVTLRNLPSLETGAPAGAEEHVDGVVDGFRQMYAFLIRHREELRKILSGWRHLSLRFVRKATQIYANRIEALARPEHLRDGADWHIAFDLLSRMFLAAERQSPQGPGVWRLLAEEAAALMQLDVPYFQVRAEGLDIANGRGETVVEDYFHTGCLERLQSKLETLNARDEALQVRYIRYAFYARAAKTFHDLSPDPAGTESGATAVHHLAPVTSDECVAAAEALAREFMAQAVRAPDGSVAWIALEYLKEIDAFQLKPVSYNLYSGTIGIALFFAALHRVTGQAEAAEHARAACRPIADVVERELDSLIRFTGLGGGVGAGSLIYGLATIAEMLDAPDFLATAHTCAAALSESQIARETQNDLIFGLAGCILGLLKLHRVAGDAAAFAAARRCGEELLARRTPQDSGLLLVPTFEGRPMTGLSHGAAGVALALMRLWAAGGDARFREAALDHVAFEEGMYDAAARNYPDYRSRPGQPAFMTTWCHGAPGIGLSRLAMDRLSPDPAFRFQAERALAAADGFTLEHLDHLCCGNLGRIDMLLEAARTSGDAALAERLRQKTRWVLDRAAAAGGFALFLHAPTQVFSPGLFVGSAGIAYALLRVAFPDRLPCVLALE